MAAHNPVRRETSLAELVTPQMANGHGTLFGGALLALVDKAAFVAAVRHSRMQCVTANFDKVEFLEPVAIGELVIVRARVVNVGNSSLSVRIRVDAEAMETGERRPVFSCFVTMVALQNGYPARVPRLEPQSEDEMRECLIARHRQHLEREYSARLREAVAGVEGMDRESLQRALADKK